MDHKDREPQIETLIVDGREARCRVILPSKGEPIPETDLPLLLLHGLGCSADAWSPSLRRLAEVGVSSPVFAPDMPGYGHSSAPPEAMGIEELADWSACLLDTLKIERTHVLGNSMGCQVAMAMAHRHPERVGGMVLVGPTTGERLISWWRYILGLIADGFQETMLYNGTLIRMYLEMGVPRYFATVQKMMENDPFTYVGEIQAPSLIVRGELDTIIPDQAARRLAAALPNGAFIQIDGTAHAVQFNRPGVFTRMALAFLSRSEKFISINEHAPRQKRLEER